jgi:hypothetical protein
MGRARRSMRAGYSILLVAMAIQGLTPDQSDLASSRLLRLVLSGLAGSRSDGGPAPSSIPTPRGQDDGVPGEICATVAAGVASRVRLDTGGPPHVHVLPVGILDHLTRSALHPLRRPRVVAWGADGLIPSLCRFRC